METSALDATDVKEAFVICLKKYIKKSAKNWMQFDSKDDTQKKGCS